MQDRDTIDFNKIDIIKPTPKQLCMRTHGECMYCQFDAPHPSATLLDWSIEDWDGNKPKAREQCPLLDFKILEKQIQKTLQDRAQDIPQDMTHNVTTDKEETDLVNGIQDLMLESKSDTQNLTDVPAPPLDMPEVKSKGEGGTNRPTMTLTYQMIDQEIQLQHEKEEYRIYRRTFGYKGDDSILDSEMDTDSNTMAYPYLE